MSDGDGHSWQGVGDGVNLTDVVELVEDGGLDDAGVVGVVIRDAVVGHADSATILEVGCRGDGGEGGRNGKDDGLGNHFVW